MGNDPPTRISVEAEMNRRAGLLDHAIMTRSGVLELRGSDFLFNPAPPNSDYFLGKMTGDQFTVLVRGINIRTLDLRLKQAQGGDVPDAIFLQVVAGAIHDLNTQLIPQGVTVQMQELVGAAAAAMGGGNSGGRGRRGGRGRGGHASQHPKAVQLLIITINPSVGPKQIQIININIAPTAATGASSSSAVAAPLPAMAGQPMVYAPAPAGYAPPAAAPAGAIYYAQPGPPAVNPAQAAYAPVAGYAGQPAYLPAQPYGGAQPYQPPAGVAAAPPQPYIPPAQPAPTQ